MIVISGPGLTVPTPGEDTVEVARQILVDLTGVNPIQHNIKNCHRSGPTGERILVEFLYSGSQSPLYRILDPKNRGKFHANGFWINIHQPRHDKHMLYLARKMRKEVILTKAYANLLAATVVVKDNKKYIINSMSDLQELTNRNVKDFLGDGNTSGDSQMEFN